MSASSPLPRSVAATAAPSSAQPGGPVGLLVQLYGLFGALPYSVLALLGRFSIAAVFWKSGQTKVQGFAIDIIGGDFKLGLPRLSDSAIDLFRDEYHVPLLSPAVAAPLAAFAEHFFSLLILVGFATRLSALGLLGMTAVIEIFVYPDAYPTHGVWATVLLLLIMQGPGRASLDHWIARRFGVAR